MPLYLSYTLFGVFLLDDDGKVLVESMIFPDSATAVEDVIALNLGNPTEALKEIVGTLSDKSPDEIVVEDPLLARALSSVTEISVRVDDNCSVIKRFRTGHDDHLVGKGIVESKKQATSFRREVALLIAKAAISTASEEKDILIKHAIDAIGELDKAINVLTMRVREWYSTHHPSLSAAVEDQETFVRVVQEFGGKTQFREEEILALGIPENTVRSIIKGLTGDTGADLSDLDLAVIRSLATRIMDQYAMRSELEEYISTMMIAVAPNITVLVGPLVGARLISLAGSLKELARKPSSTIQVFGAEKALFRSIKTGTDPPKHGVIYQVPEIHSAPYWQRGRIARSLAGKLSIAARIDAYSKRKIGEKLKTAFLKRVDDIKKQSPEAPPPKPPKPPRPKGRGGPPRGRSKKKRGRNH